MRRVLVLAILAACAAPPAAQADAPGPTRHHLTLGLGFARHVSDDFEDAGLETGLEGQVAYRSSLNRSFDLCLDGRSFMTTDDEVFDDAGGSAEFRYEHDTSYLGPGVRWSTGDGPVRPYVQANLFWVRETLRLEYVDRAEDASDTGAGFGLMAGADLHLSRSFSLPVEVNFLHGKPDLDVSSLGLQAGITYNFAPLP